MPQNLPGFYGFGLVLAVFKAEGKLSSVKKLYENSLFFRTLVENSMQSLSKADYKATRYLAEDEVYAPLWQKMHDEYEQTIALLLEISGQKTLLEANKVSKTSIEIREKIILPIILIQQYALQKLEEANTVEEADVCRKLIIRCMFGIINAARNSA
jgi:phosphoenolpyruvate carboxylase